MRGHFAIAPDAEITVECAPGTLAPALIETLLQCGVNRVSLGVQSFVDQEAQSVGRLHKRATVLEEIGRLREAGLKPKEEKLALKDSRLEGKTFVFTGSLERRSREEAGAEVAAHAGKVTGTVTKKTDYVVVGADPGSKYEKAKQLGVPILTESDFDKLLEGKLPVPVSAAAFAAGKKKKAAKSEAAAKQKKLF